MASLPLSLVNVSAVCQQLSIILMHFVIYS